MKYCKLYFAPHRVLFLRYPLGIVLILILYLSTILLSPALHAQALPPANFELIFGADSSSEKALGVKQLASGSIFMAGYSSNGLLGKTDITLSKLTPEGVVLWTRYYGSSANDDYCNAMIINAAGNFVLVGKSDTDNAGTKGIILEIDTLGSLLQMAQSDYPAPIEVYEYLQATTDNGYIVAGFGTQSSGGLNDMLLIKFNALLGEEWRQNFGGALNDVGYSIQNTAESGFIMAGDSHSFSDNVGIYLVKTGATGDFEWDLLISTDYATGVQNIITTASGDYVLVGESAVDASGAFDVIMARISPAGQLLWTNFWGGGGSDAGFAIREATDGSFYISGYSTSPNPDAPYEVLWLKTDAYGNELAHDYFYHPSIDIGYDFCPSVYGGWLIAGLSTDSGGGGQYYLAYTADPTLSALPPADYQTSRPPNSSPALCCWQGQPYCRFYSAYPEKELTLCLFNSLGSLVYRQQWSHLAAGLHLLPLEGGSANDGVFFYRIEGSNTAPPSPQQGAAAAAAGWTGRGVGCGGCP